jgi:type II secretory pathway component PulC
MRHVQIVVASFFMSLAACMAAMDSEPPDRTLAALLESARFVPFYQDQALHGFRIDNVESRSFLDELSIDSGDIVTHVDGERIDEIEDIILMYEALSESESFGLEIDRGSGETIQLEYP